MGPRFSPISSFIGQNNAFIPLSTNGINSPKLVKSDLKTSLTKSQNGYSQNVSSQKSTKVFYENTRTVSASPNRRKLPNSPTGI